MFTRLEASADLNQTKVIWITLVPQTISLFMLDAANFTTARNRLNVFSRKVAFKDNAAEYRWTDGHKNRRSEIED